MDQLLVAGGDDFDAETVALILLVWYVDGLAPLLALAGVDPGTNDPVYLRVETEFQHRRDHGGDVQRVAVRVGRAVSGCPHALRAPP